MPTDRDTAGTSETAPGPTPGLSSLGPVARLVDEPAVARVYLATLDGPVTVPQLLETVPLAKSTVYDYVETLRQAGVVVEAGETDGATRYVGREFETTFSVDGETVTITPELVEVLVHRDEAPALRTFVDRHGLGTLASFVDMAREQAAGQTTTRAIAARLDVPRGSAYDVLEHVHRALDIGDEPTERQPGETDDRLRDELLDG